MTDYCLSMENTSGAQKTSEVQQTCEWKHPDYPSLNYNDCVGMAAVQGQIQEYPKVVRRMEDPRLVGQDVGLLSFMLFKEPKKLSTGKYAYGFVKLRGNYGSVDTAKAEATKLVRDVDSKFEIKLAPVGYWVPITDDDSFTKEKFEVKEKETDVILGEQATKEKEEDDKRKMREIEKRKAELIEDGDIYDHPESLRYFSMKMVTVIRLMETREAYKKNFATIEENLEKVEKEVYKLTKANPNYVNEWIDCYNDERSKGGVPNYVPDDDQMKEHEERMRKYEEEGLDLNTVHIPKVTIPKEEEEVKKKSKSGLDIVKKQAACGGTLADIALEKTNSVVDAILFAKNIIQGLVDKTGCNKMTVVGALEAAEGNVDEACRYLEESK